MHYRIDWAADERVVRRAGEHVDDGVVVVLHLAERDPRLAARAAPLRSRSALATGCSARRAAAGRGAAAMSPLVCVAAKRDGARAAAFDTE